MALSANARTNHEINRLKDIPIDGSVREFATVKSSPSSTRAPKYRRGEATTTFAISTRSGVLYNDPETGGRICRQRRAFYFLCAVCDSDLYAFWAGYRVVHVNDWRRRSWHICARFMRSSLRIPKLFLQFITSAIKVYSHQRYV